MNRFRVSVEDIKQFMDSLEIPCPKCGGKMISEELDEFGPVIEYILTCLACDYITAAYAERLAHA